jgi:GTPase
LRLPKEKEIIIADTVGFIRDLPRDLARAFRATLEELNEADLLLHVVDAADPAHEQHITAVETILTDLGLAETPRILVMNKIDLVPDEARPALAREERRLEVVATSGQDGATTGPLLVKVEQALARAGLVDATAATAVLESEAAPP